MGLFWLHAYCELANDCEPVGVCLDFESRVVLGRAPLINVVHIIEDIASYLGDQVGFHVLGRLHGCHAVEDFVTRRGEEGFAGAIGLGGVRGGRTVLRATKGMCVIVDESVSYHARSLVTRGYEGRVC